MLPEHWKQVITLLVLTPILTELLTNNIRPGQFFAPKLFLLLVTLVYGPVLLLRELAVRWRLGLAGYMLLGLVYGIYNEGLIGKTIFQRHVGNPSFNDYGIVWGINTSWASVLIIFHAFYAFLFPLLIIYNIYPSSAGKPWLGKKWWLIISGALLVYVSYTFLKHMHAPIVPAHFVVLIATMISLVILSRLFSRGMMFSQKRVSVLPLYVYGIAFVACTFTLSNLIAVWHINYLFFLMYMLLILCTIILLLHSRYNIQALLIFCLVAQLGFVAGSLWVAIVARSRPGIYTSSILILFLLVTLVATIIKRRRTNSLITASIQ